MPPKVKFSRDEIVNAALSVIRENGVDALTARSLGASNGNIAEVFNAETFIIGCLSGLIGIGMTLLTLIPVNSVIRAISGIEGLAARLPVSSALVLVIIGIGVTMLGGPLPAKKAANKVPVVALRTE